MRLNTVIGNVGVQKIVLQEGGSTKSEGGISSKKEKISGKN
jgi:hypothetical protein